MEIRCRDRCEVLKRYYSVLANKPKAWHNMVEELEGKVTLALMPL